MAGLVNGLWLAASKGIARVNELETLWALRRLLDKTEPSLLALLPDVTQVPYQLDVPASLATFLFVAMAANASVGCVIAALLALPVKIIHGISSPADKSGSFWFWSIAYPTGVVVGFALPSITRLITAVILRSEHWAIKFSAVAVLFLALWPLVVLLVRRKERAHQLVSYSCGIGLALTCLASGAGAIAQIRVSPNEGLPNILLISIDSLRPDHLGSYGYHRNTSPAIDRLAREGTLFRTVVSSTSWTLPSHATLLTSQPPEQHAAREPGSRLSSGAMTLAEVTRGAGYSTAGFVGGPFLSANYGFSQGFDHYDDYSVNHVLSGGHGHRDVTSPTLLDAAERWLQKWNASGQRRPFFMFLHMWDVHYDYNPPPPYDRMFDPDYSGGITGRNFATNIRINKDMNPRDLEHVIALYDGEIRFTDHYLSTLFDCLDNLGIFDETIVVLTADHGEEFFEHGHKGHKKTLYDETLLVPLIIRIPPSVPRRTFEDPVRLMDVAPTILSLAGLDRPKEFGTGDPEGSNAEQDLAPYILTSSPHPYVERAAFSELIGSDLGGRVTAIRTRALKGITNSELRPREELYDLIVDPSEQFNLAGHYPALEDPVRARLSEWTRQWAAGVSPAEEVQLTNDQLEQLRSLGYVR